jgi:glutamine synthetase
MAIQDVVRPSPAPTGNETLKEVVGAPEFENKLQRVLAQITERGIQYTYFTFISVNGKLNGKYIPSPHFERTARNGIRHVYGATVDLRIDRHGRYIAFGEEETEFIGIPDLDTWSPVGWDPQVARVYCNLYYEDGKPFDADPRSNLQRITHAFEQEFGFSMRVGIEPEMMFLKMGPDGKPQGATEPICYHIKQFEVLRPLILDLLRGAREMGLNMIQGDHEDAPGQLELNIQHDWPVHTADNHATYRQLVTTLARNHGYIGSFMPKPFTGVSASGHHHHFSMVDAEGRNVFLDENDTDTGLSQTAKYFLGGLIKHADALTAICAPTVNSYKRFWDVGFWAPVFKAWGWQNRTCLVRCPGPGRYEYRGVDSSCNPYLTLAALQVAGADGLRNKIDPGEPTRESIYKLMDKGVSFEKIPMTLGEALDALKRDEVVQQALPGKLYDAFMGCRVDDWERFCAAVTDWEVEEYLQLFP